MTMQHVGERIMVVDENEAVHDLLGRQLLGPMGFEVIGARDVGEALEQAMRVQPDLIIASLTLPGLTANDLLIGLRSQGMGTPVLVMTQEGKEVEAVQASRLGAFDFLSKPLHEAEVLGAVERALAERRLEREHQESVEQLAECRRQLERRDQELAVLLEMSTAIVSSASRAELLSRLVTGARSLTRADMAWVQLHDESTQHLVLRAQSNLPDEHASQLGRPWDDGLSPLAMLSNEVMTMHGDALDRFLIGRFSKAALVVPAWARTQPIGVIGVARRELEPFTSREEELLGALLGFASAALVNARHFPVLQTGVRKPQ